MLGLIISLNLAQDTVYNGNQYESCKKTCNSNKCNIGAVGQTNECYTCSVTVDQDGNPMGWGDVECVDGALSRHIETCAGDQVKILLTRTMAGGLFENHSP